MYPEYFGDIVLLAALGKRLFFFTVSDMLTHNKSDCRTSYGTMFGRLLIPYREYIRNRDLRWPYAGSTVNRKVVAPDEFRQNVDVSVRVFVCYVFVLLIANGAMASFYLNDLLKNSLPLSIRIQIGCLLSAPEYFARTDRNAAVTVVHVFDRSSTICRNLRSRVLQ